MTGRLSRWGACGAFAATALALAGTLAACGTSTGTDANATQTIRFVWWGNQDRADATNKAVALFQKQHPNIHVQTEFSGYDAYVQKLTTEIAGGAPPDVVQLDRPTFGQYQQKHALANLDGQGALKVDKIPANLLAGGKVGGQLFAVAGGQTAQMVAYDPDAFAKAGVTVPANGWTWQEFQTDMQKVYAATGVPGTTDFGWAIDWFDSWLHQNGKSLYTSDGKLGFTAADLEQFWNLTGQMRQQHEVSAPQATTKMDGSTQNSALVTKQSASEVNYDSSLTAYETSYSGKTKAAPLPTNGTGPDASGMSALPPVYYGVPRTSQHQAAAAELINFLVNDPDAGKILGTSRGLPPNSDIRQQVCATASANDKSVCDYEQSVAGDLGSSQSWLWPGGSSAFKTDFPKIYDNVIFGKTSVSDAANQAVHEAQQALGS